MDKTDVFMENSDVQLKKIREISEGLTRIERKRQQLKIVNKTVNLKNQLGALAKRLKLPSHTLDDLKRHIKLLTELRILFRTDEANSPLNVIKKEAELLNELYDGLVKIYKSILAEQDKKY